MAEVTPHRDQRFEALFTRWKLTFEFVEDLSLDDDLHVVDEAQVRSLENIALPERVDQYSLQMKAGAVFPPIVVAAELRGVNDVMIDGNTRVFAARRTGRDTYPAYRVTVPDVAFAKMTAAALNQLGGQRLSPTEARQAALSMMEMSWDDSAVAREVGYSGESVRRWRREVEMADRLERLDLAGQADSLTKTQRQTLAKIDHDAPFVEAVKLVADTKPEPQDVKELVAAVTAAASDDAALVAVAQARMDWQPIGPEPSRVIRNPAARQAKMHLGGLLKLDPLAVYDPATADADLVKWREVRELIERVLSVFAEHSRGPAA